MGVRVALITLCLRLSAAAVMDYCQSVGDTHVRAFSGTTPQHFDVMGDDDWIIAEGPDVTGVPKLRVHGVQKVWQRCGTENFAVTVLKHAAVQCGAFHVLVDSTWAVHGCENYGLTSSDILNPKLYVKGVNFDTNRTYVALDYLRDPDFGPPFTRVNRFYDGTVSSAGIPGSGSISITASACYSQNCVANTGVMRIAVEIACAGTITKIWIHPGGFGTHMQVNVEVPSNDPQLPIRVGNSGNRNLVAGYCGGWQDSIFNRMNGLVSACSGSRFYDASCRPDFAAGVSRSLFALWEGWTKGAFESRFSSDESADVGAANEPINPAKWDKYWRICSDFGRQFFSDVRLTDKPLNPKEFMLYSTVKECAEDSYYGLIWNNDDFTRFFCQSVSFQVNQERKDVFCAAKKLQKKGLDIDPRRDVLPLIQDCKAPADIERLSVHMNAIADLSSEVKSSSDNIVYWDVPACRAMIEPTPKSDLLGTNCDVWVFRDSQSLQDLAKIQAAQARIMSSTVKYTQRTQGIVNAGRSFTNPVLFLGPPTFYGANPMVPRVNAFQNNDGFQFGVIAREPACITTFSHPEETSAFVVLDTSFNYPPGILVFTRTVTRDWGTITWDKDMGSAVVFATIQSSNNNACPTCTTRPLGVSGYVNVRIRNIGSKSCEVRLETDTSSTIALESETVAFLVATDGAKGKIGAIGFQVGAIQGTDSVGPSATSERPTIFQLINGISGFSVPNILVSVVSSSGTPNLPINLRDNNYMDGVYKFQVDRDVCNNQYGGGRNHVGERIAWIAFERV